MSDRADARLRRRVGPLAAALSGIGIVLGAGIPLIALTGLLGAAALAVFMDRDALLIGAATLALGVALSFVLLPREVWA